MDASTSTFHVSSSTSYLHSVLSSYKYSFSYGKGSYLGIKISHLGFTDQNLNIGSKSSIFLGSLIKDKIALKVSLISVRNKLSIQAMLYLWLFHCVTCNGYAKAEQANTHAKFIIRDAYFY